MMGFAIRDKNRWELSVQDEEGRAAKLDAEPRKTKLNLW
jgi:hypothetical protein